jgi:hypothetical protein
MYKVAHLLKAVMSATEKNLPTISPLSVCQQVLYILDLCLYCGALVQPCTYKRTVWRTTCSRLVLEPIRVPHLFNKFLALYGHRSFINALRRVLHWTLSWARRVHSSLFHHKAYFNIILPSTPRHYMYYLNLFLYKLIISLIEWVTSRKPRASWFHHHHHHVQKKGVRRVACSLIITVNLVRFFLLRFIRVFSWFHHPRNTW